MATPHPPIATTVASKQQGPRAPRIVTEAVDSDPRTSTTPTPREDQDQELAPWKRL